MNKSKYIYSLIIIISISNASAQEIEFIDFIRFLSENAHSNEEIKKLFSLDYIEDILYRNDPNNIELEIDLIYNILEYLAFEGTVNKSTNENIQNNFPDVRLKAVILLGQLNIIKARNAIIEVLKYENNPFIINEANKILNKN